MEFRVLGDLEVRAAGRRVEAGHARQRAVLAVLLLDLGRVVPATRLIDRVWGDDPPASVRNVLYKYVANLKAVITGTGDHAVTLSRQSAGYLLQADPAQVDLYRFRRLLAEAAAAADDDERAGVLLAQALELWRGAALTGIDSPWLNGMRQALESQRRTAVLDLGDITLRQGSHRALAASLAEEAVLYPADERLIWQLMLALYRSGRQAEALRWFERTRRQLADELGADPGQQLQTLHRQILRADPSLAVPGTTSNGHAGSSQRTVPRELPPAVPTFTGRAAELEALTRPLDRSGGQAPGAMVISAISGTAGVGKTALAVHWAHSVADRFPDGQMYVNLRGYDPAQPMPAGEALAAFLRSLGVPGQDIPPEAEQRAARYRSLLAGRRMLVVLDNASSADQIRPLLPGTSSCTVVVTSRDALAGLVARDAATRLDLDVLPPGEAVALLRTLIGARAAAEPGAAAELAAQCCRLPLALRVAAELAANRPAMPLASLADELADLRTRLDLLAAGEDQRTQVRAVFSWSYRRLGTDDARAFRLAGLHPGPDFDPYAAAALTGAGLPQARRALDVLARAHLIQPAASGRYGMHDLLRGYARELSAAADTSQEQQAALTRLFDQYLHAAAAAMDTLLPAERHHRPRSPRPAVPIPPLPDPAAAREWLDRERAAMAAAAGHTAAHAWPGHCTRLAATIARYLHNGGHFPEALTIFSHALGAARRTSDRAAEAMALNQIGNVHWHQSRYQQAGDHYLQALTLSRAASDRHSEAQALSNTGLAETQLGRCEQAARHQQEAAAIYRDIGDRFGQARAIGNLGWARQRQGRYQEAASHHQQALDLCREIGDREGEAWALSRLGVVDLRLELCQRSARYLRQALALFQEIGNTGGEAEILGLLGEANLGLGRHEQATGNFEQALTIFRKIGYPILEADALNGLGDVLLHTGDTGKARMLYATALQLASKAGTPRTQARAHSGLARACQATSDPVQARRHLHQALTRYTAIGAPEASEIRAELSAARDSGGETRSGSRQENAGNDDRPQSPRSGPNDDPRGNRS